MQVYVTRASLSRHRVERRRWSALQNRVRQLHLATRLTARSMEVDRATGDPRAVNEVSAMYGSPDEISTV